MAPASPLVDFQSYPDGNLPSLLVSACRQVTGAEVVAGHWNPGHSNDVFELSTRDGRTLVVKRARHDWAGPMFEACRTASALLRERGGIVTPEHVGLPTEEGDLPVQAYWRIPLPTLAELWPSLDEGERDDAMRSWGELIARVHDVEPAKWGPLCGPDEGDGLERVLREDLEDRLLPAVYGTAPQGAAALEALVERIPAVARRARDRAPVLVHGDLHMANILCRRHERSVRCVGLLDLDDASGGLAEDDIAGLEVLHGPHFRQELEPRWLAPLREAYGRAMDEELVAFFRAGHLANQGFHSALVGDDEHADEVWGALDRELPGLQGLES